MTRDAVLALTRFGVGARPGEVVRVAGDPRGWLLGQLRRPEAALISEASLPASDAAARTLAQARQDKRDQDKRGTEKREAAQAAQTSGAPPPQPKPAPTLPLAEALASQDPGIIRRAVYRAEVEARLAHGSATDAGFVERLVIFWSNHFAVSVDKVPMLAGAFEREAIRPHVLGRFSDLLRAVAQHPAMLVYLDNQRSVGPGSQAGVKRRLGLNENLARESLELHTLGVEGGYTQEDVTSLAHALTGWGWVPPRADDPEAGRFRFFPARHEPGPVTVLGKRYPIGGLTQGEAILDDLARHPATARHLARKLAAHFVADQPPPEAVTRLEKAFLQSGGDLAAVSAALVAAPEAWAAPQAKLKSPYEFVLSALRLQPGLDRHDGALLRALAALGQRSFAPPSPQGWPDEAAAWMAPHAFRERVDWACLACARSPPEGNPVMLAEDVLGPLLSEATRREIARAETGAQGLALLLMSPEFQRR